MDAPPDFGGPPAVPEEAPPTEVACDSVLPASELLDFRVVDAEYSRALERIIAVSAGPNALHIYDPHGEDVVVPLPLAPVAVSVAPDGVQAAVAHDGHITHVDLIRGEVRATWPVAARLGDVVLTDAGFAYGFPLVDQWVEIHTVDLVTGEATIGPHWGIYAGTVAKLHPSGTRLYGADRGISPDDIERYDLEDNQVIAVSDSPYHGDHPICGDLWLSEDGNRIFTACGVVFRASQGADDMTYNGSLDVAGVAHLTHSAAGQLVALVERSNRWDQSESDVDTWVRVFEHDFLNLTGSYRLPCLEGGGQRFLGRGRFVFVSNDGTELFVVLQADETSGFLNDFGIIRIDITEGGEG